MARRVKKYSYKDRQQIRRERDLDDGVSLQELLKFCDNNPLAFIEIETWYDDTNVRLVWTVPETDEEMAERIAKYEAALAKEEQRDAERKAKKLEHEKREYLRLKKKFEKKSKICKPH